MASVDICREGDTARVTLHNPGKLNAINLAMWTALAEIFAEFSVDRDLRCIVIRGAGNEAFAAGGDLEEFIHRRRTLEQALAYHDAVAQALERIASCPVPTVAAIRGACIGGGLEIAGACDLRICSDDSRFGAPILRLGFSMYPGEMAGLLRLVGAATLNEILLEGRLLGAHEAQQKGLVQRVVSHATFDDEVAATQRRITQGAPLVARWHKQWIARLASCSPLTPEEKRAAFAFLDTEDYQEGLAAFLEKRPPVFKAR